MLQPTKGVPFFMYNVALIWPKNYLDLRPGTTSCFFKKVFEIYDFIPFWRIIEILQLLKLN